MLRVAAFLALATSAHGYSFSNPVANEESVLVAAQNITVLAAAADFAGAKAAYENSGVLKTLASTDETGDVTFDVYKAYFGGASGVHETTLLACLDGTGAWAVGTGEAANVKDDARKECIEKLTTDAIPFLHMLVNLNKAIAQAEAGNTATATAAAAQHVDRAYALYRGDPSDAPNYSIWHRGNLRGGNFKDATGNVLAAGTPLVAFLTTTIVSDFQTLKQSVVNPVDLAAARSAKQRIAARAQLIYHMATLRYAYQLDEHVNDGTTRSDAAYKSQGEGQAFWRTIAPLVTLVAPSGAAALTALFDLAVTPTTTSSYCAARATLRLALPATLTLDDIGELEDTMGDPTGITASFAQCTSYAPVNSVLDYAGVSSTAREINTALMAENFALAKAAYTGSHLEALAKATPEESAYAKHFGSASPYHDFFVECADNKGVWADKTPARLECLQKLSWDAVPFHTIDELLQAALTDADGNRRGLTNAALHVDRAYALFLGGDHMHSPYNRGNKRGPNFYEVDGDQLLVDSRQVALNNNRIEAAFVDLQAEVRKGSSYSSAKAAELVETIFGQLQVTYIQATVRYAALLDTFVSDEATHDDMYDNQGEGWTFFRVIEPLVAKRDKGAAKLIKDRYNLANMPVRTDFYCHAYRGLVTAKRPSGVTLEHIGILENTVEAFYEDDEVPAYFSCPSDYVPTSLPAAQFDAAQTMIDLKALIADAVDSNDWKAIKELYVGSDVQALAQAEYDGEPRYDAYKALYGKSWMDVTIVASLDGTGTFTVPSARGEIFEKTALDAVGVNEMYHHLHKAVAEMDTTSVDAAWGLYTGSAGAPLLGTLYDRAQKRGANYLRNSTGEAFMLDDKGVALTNIAMFEQLTKLKVAIQDDKEDDAKAARAQVEKQLYVIYYQCVLRYAYLLDADNLAQPQLPYEEHQAEGWAFWKVIEPIIVAADDKGAAQIEALFKVTGKRPAGVTNYCMVRRVLDDNRPADTTEADFGFLESVPAGHCGGLSGGAIAGIVIGVMAFAAIVAGSLFFYWRSLKAKSARSNAPVEITYNKGDSMVNV